MCEEEISKAPANDCVVDLATELEQARQAHDTAQAEKVQTVADRDQRLVEVNQCHSDLTEDVEKGNEWEYKQRRMCACKRVVDIIFRIVVIVSFVRIFIVPFL